MITPTEATFDIRNFSDRLTSTSKKNRYICPACGGNNLTINPKDGAYKCWNECECKAIREAIAPWDEVKTPNKGSSGRVLPKPLSKNVPPAPSSPMPFGELALVRLPETPQDVPQLTKLQSKPPKGIPGNANETVYTYSSTQWVTRYQWEDTSTPKGYDKTFRQWHRLPDGTPEMKKGEKPWSAYRLDEAITAAVETVATAGTPVLLQHEGEGCVEIGRVSQLAGFTFQGSAWNKNAIKPEYQRLKSKFGGEVLVVFLHDLDETGLKKAQTCADIAAEIGLPFIPINPRDICPNLPYESSDIKEILGQMDVPEFIKRLEEEIYRAVDERRSQAKQKSDDERLEIPDSVNPNVTFLQQALNFLYGDKPWICANDKLYYWIGTNYKHSPDAVERPRIASFCNSYPVSVTDKNGNITITYPYAKPSKVREVLQWVKDRFEVDPDLLNPSGLNCTNGVLQIIWDGRAPGSKLIDHDPALYYTYEPVVTYNPDADPKDCDRLLDVLDKPQREIFLRTIAASLDLATVRRYKGRLVRGLLLKGDGNNGKDTLREAVAAMYGYQGMTGCTLSDFKAYDDGRKFPLSRLNTSRVNWATENANTAALDKLQSVKAFLTGDTLSTEGKGKDELDYTPNAVGLFNVNDTPNLRGTLEAIISRWGVLSFTKTFKIGADPSIGELEADPRFKYDPDFMRVAVLPAFLNRVLQAMVDLMRQGIDYSCTQKALEDIQRENSHLFQFCQDAGLGYDPNSTLQANEIWDLLEGWYQDNGTLTYESGSSGKPKAIWNEQPRKSDPNVKAVNQVIARFSVLFPKAKVVTVAKEGGGKPRMGLQGIGSISPITPEASPNFTQQVTQFSPNTSPNEALLDLGFHPSHPISSTPGRKNEKFDNSMNYSDVSPPQSSVTPPKLGDLGEKVGTASKFGCSTGCNLGDASPKLGDELGDAAQTTVTNDAIATTPQLPPVGSWVEVVDEFSLAPKLAQVVKHLGWGCQVTLDGKDKSEIFGSYPPGRYRVLSKQEMLEKGLLTKL